MVHDKSGVLMCGGIGGGGPNGLIDLEGYCWVLEGSGGIEKVGLLYDDKIEGRGHIILFDC